MKPSSNYAIFIVYPYAKFLRSSGTLVLRLTIPVSWIEAFIDILFYWISYAKYLSDI